MYALRDGGELAPERAARIAQTMATGRGDPIGALPDAFSHRPSELAAELHDAGLLDVDVLGIEGPAWPLFTHELPEERVERLLEAAIRTARLYDGHPDMTAAGAHLLGIGRRG